MTEFSDKPKWVIDMKTYYIANMPFSDELYHYGRKGQKWGVRNGPPYPLDKSGLKRFKENTGAAEVGRKSRKKEIKNRDGSVTYPKGFIFNRYGNAKLDVNRTGGLYVTNTTEDAARYMKEFGGTKLSNIFGEHKRLYVQHIKADEDIKVPSREQLAKITARYLLDFNSSYEQPKWYQLMKLAKEQDEGRVPPSLNEADLKDILKNPSSKKAERLVYDVSKPLGASPQFANEYYERIRKSGFDAIMDYNDKDRGLGQTPMIIVNPQKVKQYDTTVLTRDLIKAGKQYAKKLEKLPNKWWNNE